MRSDKLKLFSVGELIAAGVCLILTLSFTLHMSGERESGISRLLSGDIPTFTDREIIHTERETERQSATSRTPEESGTETQPSVAQDKEPDVFETPEDILEMQKEFLEEYKDRSPAGEVKETFFTTQGVTDTVGKVRIKNSTHEQTPDFEALLNEGTSLEIDDIAEPTVLIFHTHTSEGFLMAHTGSFYDTAATRSLDPDKSIVRVGTELASVLESHGIGVIHDTAVYDEQYNGAYARSREPVLTYLEKYPSIKIVLDVHRDAIYSSDTVALKPTAEIGGKKAAQIMIITGAEEGQVTDFPNWEENLKFSLALQNIAETTYEGLMRPIFFCQRKYNMDVTPYSLLLEIGSDTNTLEEAVYAGVLFGEVLSKLILDL